MPPPYVAITAGSFFGSLAAGALTWHFFGATILRGAAAARAAVVWAFTPPPPPPGEAPEARIARLRREMAALESEVEELQSAR